MSATFIGPKQYVRVNAGNALDILMEFHDVVLQKDIFNPSRTKNITFTIEGGTQVHFKGVKELRDYYSAWVDVYDLLGALGKKGGVIQRLQTDFLKRTLSKWLDSFKMSFDVTMKQGTSKHDQNIFFTFKGSSTTYGFASHGTLKTYIEALKIFAKNSEL